MTQIQQNRVGNLLLARLAPDDFALLQPHLKRVPHRTGDRFASLGDPMDWACFPEGAVTAMLAVLLDGRRLAVGLVGREGLVGSSLLHGCAAWQQEVVVRAAESSALRIESAHLLAACRKSDSLRDLLLRFAGNLSVQIASTSISNLACSLEQRMARWILLYHDRLGGSEVVITHQEISIMLGVRRASATDVLHVLEGMRAIRCTRGHIFVRDRPMLEELAGESYGGAEADYRRQIGPCDFVSIPDLRLSPAD